MRLFRSVTMLVLVGVVLAACGAATPTPQAGPSQKKFSAAQQVIDVTHSYRATLDTARGKIVIDLFPKTAPKNVNSFVFLAQQGFYSNVTFHRVLADFMAQTGDPTGTGMGGPGYTTPLEINPSVKFDQPGRVGVARSGDPNSAGSQFFITFNATPWLDPNPAQGNAGYTVIGQVVQGMDVLRQIRLRDPDTNPNFAGDALLSVTVEDVTGK